MKIIYDHGIFFDEHKIPDGQEEIIFEVPNIQLKYLNEVLKAKRKTQMKYFSFTSYVTPTKNQLYRHILCSVKIYYRCSTNFRYAEIFC